MASSTKTLSSFGSHYMKLLVLPRSNQDPVIDRATLHLFLQQAAIESFGTVGAGAMSSIGDGMEIVLISNGAPGYAEDKSSREVILKVASSAITPFMAMLPMSSASERYSFEILGHSPSLPLVKSTRSHASSAGTRAWLDTFEEA